MIGIAITRLRHPRSWLVGLLALAVSGCLSTPSEVTWNSGANVGCALEPVRGKLVDISGHTAITDARFFGPLQSPLWVLWPEGWQVRPSTGGLEVLDEAGSVRARTGGEVALWAASGGPDGPGMPMIINQALRTCPPDPIAGI